MTQFPFRLWYLNFLTAATQIGKHLIDTFLIDYAQTFAGDTKFNETLFSLYPKTMGMQVRLEATARFVLRVGYVVSGHRLLTGNLTYSGHDLTSRNSVFFHVPSPM